MYFELIKTMCRACGRQYEVNPEANVYGPYGSMCHQCRCAKETLDQMNEVESAPKAAAENHPFSRRLREAWRILIGPQLP